MVEWKLDVVNGIRETLLNKGLHFVQFGIGAIFSQ